MGILHREGHTLLPSLVEDPREVLGVNNRVELATADRILRERKVHVLMLGGVTIEKPETVIVDEDVEAGSDTVIEAFAQLRGATRVGAGCRIGAGSILRNVQLADGVRIQPYSVIEDTEAAEGVQIGPFARLRGGNRLAPKVRIGNFVELKNAEMEEGAKANHLAYLGDAEVGKGSNIGAGTITCNYDGFHKNHTRIGEGTFVGSNSTLVAPLHVGAGSFIAAGSVITHNVPDSALAFGRARQAIKDGGAELVRHKASTKQQG